MFCPDVGQRTDTTASASLVEVQSHLAPCPVRLRLRTEKSPDEFHVCGRGQFTTDLPSEFEDVDHNALLKLIRTARAALLAPLPLRVLFGHTNSGHPQSGAEHGRLRGWGKGARLHRSFLLQKSSSV